MNAEKGNTDTSNSSLHTSVFIPLLILAVGLILRVTYVLQIKGGSPFYAHPVVDAALYDSWGWAIAQGDWLGGKRIFYDPPLYAYFLGIIYRFFGHNYLDPRLIQALLGSITCVFIYFLGKRLSGGSLVVGAAAGLIAALYKPFIFYDAALLKASLTCFLVGAGFLSVLYASERRSMPLWLLTGAITGLLAMLRVNMLLFGILGIAIWAAILLRGLRTDREQVWGNLKLSIAFIAGLMITLLPGAVRNYHVGGEFVIVSSYMGQNFYTGNNPYNMNDNYQRLSFARANPKYEEDDFKARALFETGRDDMAPSEVSDYWMEQSFKFIMEEPFAFLRRMAKRTLIFFGEGEVPDTHNIYFEERFASVLKWPLLTYALIGPLSIMGMLLGLRKFKKLWLLYMFVAVYALSIIPFFVFARYRLPSLVPQIVFAGLGIGYIWEGRNRGKTIALSIAFLLPSIALVNLPHLYEKDFADSYTNLGTLYFQQGRYGEAALEYKRALEISRGDPMLIYYLAYALRMGGKFEQAEKLYRHIIETGQSQRIDTVYVANAHAGLGVIFEELGRIEEAMDEYDKTLILAPGMEDIRKRHEALIKKN